MKQHLLNSTSEYTSREVYSGLCLFLSIVYLVFQRCPTKDEISFPVDQSNCKKRSKFSKISKFQNFTKFKKKIKMSYKISKSSKNFKIMILIFFLFLKFKMFKIFQNLKIKIFFFFYLDQNFHKISKLKNF